MTTPDLKVVSNEPTEAELRQIAMEHIGRDVSPAVIADPKIRAKLVQVFEARRAEEARRAAEAEAQRAEAEATELLKQLNKTLHPAKPKEEVVFLKKEDIAAHASAQTRTKEEEMAELRKELGEKFPAATFTDMAYAMALRGSLNAVRRRFQEDAQRTENQEARLLFSKKAEQIERAFENVTKIVAFGHGVDPRDPKNFASNVLFSRVRNDLIREPTLMELCKMPETLTERAERLRREEEEKQKREARLQEQREARETMTKLIIDRMLKVPYFTGLGTEAMRTIASRIAKRFDGSSESRLKQAADEKRGGAVSNENRKLGVALARAAGCSDEELARMFPGKKEKKEKQKR